MVCVVEILLFYLTSILQKTKGHSSKECFMFQWKVTVGEMEPYQYTRTLNEDCLLKLKGSGFQPRLEKFGVSHLGPSGVSAKSLPPYLSSVECLTAETHTL